MENGNRVFVILVSCVVMKDRAKKILIFTLGAAIFPKIVEILISNIIAVPDSVVGICGLLYVILYAFYPIIVKNKRDRGNMENIFYFSAIYFSLAFVLIFVLFLIIFLF